ncbi:MAG TPA: peptide ABC transporter substrate-binding protein [Candidatus Limnocylindrales bacterium]|nr:peptide ABC transporter substrate-binding protein [Candidatus Limnocylindrales bacterium]
MRVYRSIAARDPVGSKQKEEHAMTQSPRRTRRWLAASAACLIALSACTSATSPSAAPSSGPPSAAPSGGASAPPASAAPRGGTINYITFAEPASLNPRMLPEGIAFQVGELVNRGLTEFDNQGNVYAELAQKVPDPADGDASADLLTVTWKIKEGATWSDGTPLTSDDLRYTWEVCGDPTTGCAKNAGLIDVESVDTPDPQTIVLHYRRPFADYKVQFREGILPRTCADCGAPGDIAKWKYQETVNPNLGPFSIVEWKHGEKITLTRNENFYLKDEGKPYLDGVNVIFGPDIEPFRQAILTGAADVSPWGTKLNLAQIQGLVDSGAQIGSGSSPYQNRLQVNTLGPDRKPHPILGDPKVREAILLGSNVDNIVGDWTVPGYYESPRMTARADLYGKDWNCGNAPLAYDPERANQLLDEAGWVKGSDGIRTKDGKKLSLGVTTYTGFYQEDNVVAWISELAKLGIDARAQNVTATELYSSYADNSPMFTGNYDLLFYDFAKDFGADPQTDYELFYRSTNTPTADNSTGRNINGVSSPEIDRLLDEASTTIDPAQRKAAYCRISEIVNKELFAENYTGIIPNWQMLGPKVKGWTDGELYVWFGSDSENWYLEQ